MVDIAIPSGRDSSYILALSRLALGTNRCARAAPRVLPSSAGHRPCRRSIWIESLQEQKIVGVLLHSRAEKLCSRALFVGDLFLFVIADAVAKACFERCVLGI
eukprot:1146853-Pelagomonas_calceolata.AAC.2